MKFDSRGPLIPIIIALLAGLGLGLAYSWLISPVTYVDANPSILRTDFKDQYRIVIAASYAATHDLPRARARLSLLGDVDLVGEMSAQAQRMLANGDTFEQVRPLAQLATDLQQGYASLPISPTVIVDSTATPDFPIADESLLTGTPVFEFPTTVFEVTPLTPQVIVTNTPRPTATPKDVITDPFTLVGQDTICDESIDDGLLQITLMDGRRKQIPGIEVVITWDQGQDHSFTGLKPELGDGYADFIMKPNTIYSIRVVQGGSFVANITAPICTDSNGASYTGGLRLTFQQP